MTPLSAEYTPGSESGQRTAEESRMKSMESMEDERLPCVELLYSTPDILRGLMSELTEEDARW